MQQLSPTASIQDTQKWLLKNRFNSYARLFSNFSGTHVDHALEWKRAVGSNTDFLNSLSGSDLLKLTREDVVQICGPADGIRLFNALKSRWVWVCVSACLCQDDIILMFDICVCRSVRPRLTVYVCQEGPADERQGSTENGENSISPGLHGKNAPFEPPGLMLVSCLRLPFISLQCITRCIWRSPRLQN